MTFTSRTTIALAANSATREARGRATGLTLTIQSSREDLIAWLMWNDPNGSHTDALADADRCERHDLDSAWDSVADMVTEHELND